MRRDWELRKPAFGEGLRFPSLRPFSLRGLCRIEVEAPSIQTLIPPLDAGGSKYHRHIYLQQRDLNAVASFQRHADDEEDRRWRRRAGHDLAEALGLPPWPQLCMSRRLANLAGDVAGLELSAVLETGVELRRGGMVG